MKKYFWLIFAIVFCIMNISIWLTTSFELYHLNIFAGGLCFAWIFNEIERMR